MATDKRQQGKRLQELIEKLSVTQSTFSKKIGVTQSYVNQMLTGAKSISYKAILGITNSYKTANLVWLLTGEGDTFLTNDLSKTKKAETWQFPHFGTNLSELRSHTNMAVSDLASRMQTTAETITDLEKGRLAPDLQTLLLIREVFGVPIDTLLFEDLSLDEMTQIKENASLFIKQQEQINQLMKAMERIGEKVDKVVDRVEKIETTGKK